MAQPATSKARWSVSFGTASRQEGGAGGERTWGLGRGRIPTPETPREGPDACFRPGTKEDSPVPTIEAGSIPNNKSDLLNFGITLEQNASGRFLHMFWHRVQEPTGTTNMDFEFNQSRTLSSNGVTPVRTAGDLLIQYDLASGGTNPELFLSKWVTTGPRSLCEAANSTPCWGDRENLTDAGLATGSINTTAIVDDPNVAGDPTDWLATGGTISARTFGEATVDFDALSGTDPCVGFGSAYLKSRASDSFTAALKDFIAPRALNIDQCGAIRIIKTAKHADKSGNTSPNLVAGFTIKDSEGNQVGQEVFTNANGRVCVDKLQLGTYTVKETTLPKGYDGPDPDTRTVVVDNAAGCGVTPFGGESVSFENTPLTDITVSVNSQVPGGTASTIECTDLTATPPDTTPSAFDDTSETFKNLEPGTYNCTVVVDP